MGLNIDNYCENYMDLAGYYNLLNHKKINLYRNNCDDRVDIIADKQGKDIGLFDPVLGRETWVDEKFITGGIINNSTPTKAHLPVTLLIHNSGRIAHGALTSPWKEYKADIWLFGIPKGDTLDCIKAMEVYAVRAEDFREEIKKYTGLTMEELYKKGEEMLKYDIDEVHLVKG